MGFGLRNLVLAVGAALWLTPAAGVEVPDSTTIDHESPVIADIRPRPRAPASEGRRCTPDGTHCVTLANYIPDVCRVIEATARENALDEAFFARLLWQESLFDAGAVSPAGAEGIAQFIPETARRRGLRDPFNPAEAMYVSARYLAELAEDYGNIGLAAAAYNAGEAGLERFLAGGSLPGETRAYVFTITGHPAETWRDAPPEALDLTLDKAAAFQPACIARAEGRGAPQTFAAGAPTQPWGVVVAFNREISGLQRQIARLQNRHGLLRDEAVAYTRGRRPGMSRRFHYAQVGRGTRAEATALCDSLRLDGAHCMVLRN